MSGSRLLLGLILALAAWQGLQWWQLRAVQQPQGVLAPNGPAQSPSTAAPIAFGDFTLRPRASYRIEARLLARKPYRLGREASLSPLDFALGWGLMSDSFVLEALDISQSGRFFWMRWGDTPPADEQQLLRHAANVHLIPSDKAVRQRLARMRPGQVVELAGLLVDAERRDGWRWNTSLSRDDTGAGACELFWVQSAAVTRRGR